jgi:ubiquinone/menaquinone biosynthesis C-methylase UbiE
MVNRELVSYEDSVNWIRGQEQYLEFVKFCYLDRNNLEAAKRFAASEEFQEVVKLLHIKDLKQPVRVLDLGCGNGIASYSFASLGYEVTSVDPDLSNDVGLMATERLRDCINNGSIETVQATAESLPFANNTFDLIYERQALHHFSDLVKGLTECVRVLKPGGLFLATREHVVDNDQQLEQFLATHILHQLHGGENAYSIEHYTNSLKQAGFKLAKRMAPMDNIINHFPFSNADVKKLLRDSLTSKLGNSIGNSIAQIPLAEQAYRRYGSIGDRFPGRLYSFLCTK